MTGGAQARRASEGVPHHGRSDDSPRGASDLRSRVVISILAGVALMIAVYFGLYQWRLIGHVWDPVFGNQTMQVLDSDIAQTLHRWMRMPDAILGAMAYLGDIVLALAGSKQRWKDRPWLVLLFGLDVIAISVVSAVLISLQGFVVDAWCFLCFVTAALSLIMAAMALPEVWTSIRFLHRVRRRSDFTTFWNTLWGRPSPVAWEISREMEWSHG